jgi:hypothetical protein
MGAPLSPDALFKNIVKLAAKNLSARRFSHDRQTFRKIANGNCGIINFQKSQSSSKDHIIFTINIGVFYGSLAEDSDCRLTKADVWDAHLRERIGLILADRHDKWWEITPETNAGLMFSQNIDVACERAADYVNKHLTIETIVDLWESGKSPGLTDHQRIKYLSVVKNKLKSNSPP